MLITGKEGKERGMGEPRKKGSYRSELGLKGGGTVYQKKPLEGSETKCSERSKRSAQCPTGGGEKGSLGVRRHGRNGGKDCRANRRGKRRRRNRRSSRLRKGSEITRRICGSKDQLRVLRKTRKAGRGSSPQTDRGSVSYLAEK